MIDYLTVMLINMSAGLTALACFVLKGLRTEREAHWAGVFAMTGLVAFVAGLHMTLTWPLPGDYSVAFGEPALLYGIIFLGIACALWKRWTITPVAVYSVFAGAAAVLVGARIMTLHMTNSPVLAGLGFITTGVSAILLLPVVVRQKPGALDKIMAVLLCLAAAVWAFIGWGAYWMHLKTFGK